MYSYFCSYSCSYCLDVFKVSAILLEVDWSLVEEPLESHIQRCVVCCLAAQHHALPHSHLHSARAKIHTHGLWKHKAAALSPQANPELVSSSCIWLWHRRQTDHEYPTLTLVKNTHLSHINILLCSDLTVCSASMRQRPFLCLTCVLVIWFLNVRALVHGWASTMNFLAPEQRWVGGGGGVTLGSVYWWPTCANLAENNGPQGITYLLPTVWQSSLPSPTDSLPGTHSSPHPLGWS